MKNSAGIGVRIPLRNGALRSVRPQLLHTDSTDCAWCRLVRWVAAGALGLDAGGRQVRAELARRMCCSCLRLLTFSVCFALLTLSAPASAVVDEAPQVTLKSGRLYRMYGDLLVPVEMGPGIEGAFNGNRWPQARLLYSFHSSVSASQQTDFRQWVAQWTSGAGVQFVEDASASNRVLVQVASQIGCGSSVLGMIGGVQDLVIGNGPNCWQSGVVLHELGHALGAIHEHQRSDRASFVTITDHGIVANCGQSTWDANYKILQTDTQSAYDYASIMHYPSPAHYTCNGVDVTADIQVLQAQPAGAPSGSQNACASAAACQAIIGSRSISARDRYGMALRYGYRLQVNIVGNGSGSIQVDGSRESCGTRCYLVAPGTLFKVFAIVAPNSIASFSGPCIGQACQFQPVDNDMIQVRFTKKTSVAGVLSILSQPLPDRIFSNGFDAAQ